MVVQCDTNSRILINFGIPLQLYLDLNTCLSSTQQGVRVQRTVLPQQHEAGRNSRGVGAQFPEVWFGIWERGLMCTTSIRVALHNVLINGSLSAPVSTMGNGSEGKFARSLSLFDVTFLPMRSGSGRLRFWKVQRRYSISFSSYTICKTYVTTTPFSFTSFIHFCGGSICRYLVQ